MRYRGKGSSAKPILFLGHLDVVEAKAADWSMDPFKLTEKDGWLYGRGTIDMKNGDAALVELLIRLKREHFTPPREMSSSRSPRTKRRAAIPTARNSC